MGYYKDLDIEKLQDEILTLEAERAADSYRQPAFSKDFSDYPEADSLLDFVRIFNARKNSLLGQPRYCLGDSLSLLA
jgi:hypothetical protein